MKEEFDCWREPSESPKQVAFSAAKLVLLWLLIAAVIWWWPK